MFCLVFNRGGVNRLREEASSISKAKSTLIAGTTHGRPVLDVSITPMPPTIQSCNVRQGWI